MRKIIQNIISLIVIGGLVLSWALPGVQAAEKPTVVATFYPVYFLAKEIAGEAAEVSMLLGREQDAHTYEPSAQDAGVVQAADLFIYQNEEMEFFVSDLLKVAETENTHVLEATEGLDLVTGEVDHDHAHDDEHMHEQDDEHAHDHEHEHGESHNHDHDHSHEYDPHSWLDPLFYGEEAKNVRDTLIAVDPDNEAIYTENTDQLLQELEVLDVEYRTALADLEARTFIVQHAAFGYLAEAYDLEQVAIAGLSTDQEPSAQALAQMQDFIQTQSLETIYIDPLLSTDISETVANATGAVLKPLRTLELVSAEEEAAGEDYFSIMRANLEQLLENK